jgi:hypothetical protein
MRTTPSSSKTNGAAARAAQTSAMPARLDDLLELDPGRLAALYAAASVPRLADLTGDLRGRMLAWHGVRGLGAAALRALGKWDRFPWRGKSFRHATANEGEGDNRVFADRFHLFRFATSIGLSRAGQFDAVHLDYDHPGNPFFIRAIHDEVRQLRPGLYLGQAWLMKPFAPRLLLYFGLERRQEH